MEVTSGAFFTAIDFVSKFAHGDRPILFTPEGHFVRVSAQGQHSFGEYWMDTRRPLAERFAVKIDRLPRIAAEINDGTVPTVNYEKVIDINGSRARFLSGGRDWQFNYCDSESVERPELKQQFHERNDGHPRKIAWNGAGLIRYLRLMQATYMRDECNRWPDVQFSRVNGVRRIAAATNHIYSTAHETDSERGDMAFLIHRMFVPQVVAVAYSQGEVEFREGLENISVECGKRKAVFPRSVSDSTSHGMDREFPLFKSVEPRIRRGGYVDVSARELSTLSRQIGVDSAKMRLSASRKQLFGSPGSATASVGRTIPVREKWGRFAGFSVFAEYIAGLSSHWPDETLWIRSGYDSDTITLTSGTVYSVLATCGRTDDEPKKKETRDTERPEQLTLL